MLFFNNIRFQIAATAVLIIIIFDYLRNPHLKLMSTNAFRAMLICTVCNLMLDISTVYTVTHLDTVPPQLNRFLHQLFIASVIMVLFFNFLYVLILNRNQERLTKRTFGAVIAPLAVAAAVIIAGRLEFFASDKGAYSYGLMADMVYVCGLIYLVMTFGIIYSKKCTLSSYQKISVQVGMFIWLGSLIVQRIFPTVLLSGLGCVLMVLCVYFSFENQRENYDAETMCFNRNAFHRQMAEYYANRKPLSIVNVTLENYERINTMYGHEYGRKAMLCAKEMIDGVLGGSVFHSRSNTFTVFYSDCEVDCRKLESLRHALCSHCFPDAQLEFRISVIDLRKYSNGTDEAYELMRFMKEYGKSSDEVICRLDDSIIEKKFRRDKIDKLLTEAVQNDGFEMVYQPIYSTEQGRFRSAEALVRMKNTGDLGFISPEEFIPIAEEKGLIMDIGDITLRLVADFAKRRTLTDKLEYIEVNLSGIQACAPELEGRLTKILAEYDIPPAFINLEITETAALDSGEAFDTNVSALRESGFSFSMDDFGTGYSNLSQMNQMRYDLVKMDKSIIWDAFGKGNEKSERLLASVIRLLKAINVKIVAEGVETKEMTDYLTERGVDYLQGYYFSKPVNEDKFLEVISA